MVEVGPILLTLMVITFLASGIGYAKLVEGGEAQDDLSRRIVEWERKANASSASDHNFENPRYVTF